MKIIENIYPFKLSDFVDKIIVNYTIAVPPTGEEDTTYLAAPDNFNKEKTEEGLKLLVDFGYIKSFSKMMYLSSTDRYKEEGFHAPISISMKSGKDFPRKVQYKIYHFQDKKKWDFIQGRRLEPDIPLNIDEDKVNKMIMGYSVGNKGIVNIFDKLKIKYSHYFTNHKGVSIDELQDFLYCFAYVHRKEFENIVLNTDEDTPYDAIRIEDGRIIGLRGKKESHIVTLIGKKEKLIKELYDIDEIPRSQLLKLMGQKIGAFEKTLTDLNHLIQDYKIGHILKISCKNGQYSLRKNK